MNNVALFSPIDEITVIGVENRTKSKPIYLNKFSVITPGIVPPGIIQQYSLLAQSFGCSLFPKAKSADIWRTPRPFISPK